MRSLLMRLFAKLPVSAQTAVKEAWLTMPIATTRHINRVYWQLHEEAEITRSRIDVPADLALQFVTDQNTPEFLDVYNVSEPLVSICVATYNRAEIVTERTLKSLINQTYKNIEVIVVGDCCTDNTKELIEALNDPRIHFLNLAERGHYPPESRLRWMVAGTVPMNKSLELARGEYICHCDDDDEFDSYEGRETRGFYAGKKAPLYLA